MSEKPEVKDELDGARAKVWALIYHMATMEGGIVRIHPDIHGIYETWEAAERARNSKSQPNNYHNCVGHWRRS